MAARTEVPRRPRGNGSIERSAGLDGSTITAPVPGIAAQARTQDAAVAALTRRLNRVKRESAESRQRIDELEGALERRTRRLQQLIGERERLTALLAGRDTELQRLNRELGALTERAAPTGRGAAALLAAARAVLERIRRPRGTPRPAQSAAARPQKAEYSRHARHLVPWVKDGPPKAVLAVAVFGLAEPEVESVLDIVEPYCAERGLAPLLLTDNDAFQLFRGRRLLFEFLPARSEQERLAPELDWQLFILRRLALIRRKWQPLQVIAFGRTAAEVVQRWVDSPFEATPLPAQLKNRSEQSEPGWSAAGPRVARPQ